MHPVSGCFLDERYQLGSHLKAELPYVQAGRVQLVFTGLIDLRHFGMLVRLKHQLNFFGVGVRLALFVVSVGIAILEKHVVRLLTYLGDSLVLAGVGVDNGNFDHGVAPFSCLTTL